MRWKPDSDSDSEPRAHLAMYPAPSTNDTLTIVYRATATRIQGTNDVLDIPLPLEPVFLEYFRAYCRGVMLRHEGSLVMELAAVRASQMFRSAVTSQMPYRVIQPSLGNVGRHMLDEEWPGDDYYARRW
jgi:hypothetical protein